MSAAFAPTKVVRLELGAPLPELDLAGGGARYERALCLAVLHGQPLGFVSIEAPGGRLTAGQLAEAVWAELAREIREHLASDGLPAAAGLSPAGLQSDSTPDCLRRDEAVLQAPPFISIVIPTRDRAEIRGCLERLTELAYPSFEVVVVDNASRTDAARLAVEALQDRLDVRYVREDRPGISNARNRGLAAARGEIVACIDDDVQVDSGWLTGLARGFAQGPNVAAVTGLIVPLDLETPAQALFEGFARFTKGATGRLFDLGANRPLDPLFPYALGAIGTGANFAFRRDVLGKLGGFDPALGVGSPAHGGEDLEMLFRVLEAGWQVRYEPRAMVYHSHPADYQGLQRRTYLYGVGLTAYLTKLLLDNPRRLVDVSGRLPRAVRHVFDPRSTKNASRGRDFPRTLATSELRGMLYGPLAYLKSRCAAAGAGL